MLNSRFFFILAPFVLSSVCFAAPSRWVDGQVQVAKAEVNKKVCWTEREKADAITYVQNGATEPVTIQDFNDPFELSIASSGIKFDNYSDFVDSLQRKDRLEDKILDMKPSDEKRNRQTIDFLKIENSKR